MATSSSRSATSAAHNPLTLATPLVEPSLKTTVGHVLHLMQTNPQQLTPEYLQRLQSALNDHFDKKKGHVFSDSLTAAVQGVTITNAVGFGALTSLVITLLEKVYTEWNNTQLISGGPGESDERSTAEHPWKAFVVPTIGVILVAGAWFGGRRFEGQQQAAEQVLQEDVIAQKKWVAALQALKQVLSLPAEGISDEVRQNLLQECIATCAKLGFTPKEDDELSARLASLTVTASDTKAPNESSTDPFAPAATSPRMGRRDAITDETAPAAIVATTSDVSTHDVANSTAPCVPENVTTNADTQQNITKDDSGASALTHRRSFSTLPHVDGATDSGSTGAANKPAEMDEVD